MQYFLRHQSLRFIILKTPLRPLYYPRYSSVANAKYFPDFFMSVSPHSAHDVNA